MTGGAFDGLLRGSGWGSVYRFDAALRHVKGTGQGEGRGEGRERRPGNLIFTCVAGCAFIGNFPDGRGPSPSPGLDTALVASKTRIFRLLGGRTDGLDARRGGPGHLRAPSGLTAAPRRAGP